ncbi:L-serine ammonia-lyase, iron-sulfur-dependent subunit beta [Clostridium sp. MSJ-4]|uniref:L-serine deaminase n=1 Tax=Clostridium simiarum TaxID=2841506 RepID=A0ABS6F0I9_9CLOT|nr:MULTISPECIES: L-serine ammonia-lyase, iron-sulfur-dependent subunit beta [Clostridium]MBU5591384.1 L-serine ammonia-lyase, iron-sulfur-dependent subunit beta [Clostridium simiarum]
MKKFGVFDILGPVMIGPSSSHTAGAARLGKIAGIISGSEIKKVEFLLHGSFAKTYKGHGTDRALVAGIMGMDPDDERLRESLQIAKDKGIEIEFKEADLGDVHPNTVKFLITLMDDSMVTVMGSSIGGGSISILGVDEEEVEFTGEYPTLIVKHIDVPGIISKVTSLIYEEGINIAFMRVFRSTKGSSAIMIFETDNVITKRGVERIKSMANVTSIRAINPVREGV